jgi:endonuclease YncB( thermonuclease family)
MRQPHHITATTAPARIVRHHRHQGDAGRHQRHDDAHHHAADQRQQPDQDAPCAPARFRRRAAMALVTAIVVAMAAASTGTAGAEPAIGDIFTGPARIIDGDTLEIGGQSIRLFGIDTPERGEAGFAVATGELRAMTANADVTCRTVDVDRYARAVGLCRIGGAEAVTEQQETLSESMLATCLARRLSWWNHQVSPAMRARLDSAACQ